MAKPTFTLEAVSKKAGVSFRTAKKRLEGHSPKDEQEAVSIVLAAEQEKAVSEGDNVDPETGLTWFQAKTKEEALRIRRENEREERVERKEWMPSSEHLETLTQLCQKLEQVPFKAKSELGLTDQQRKQLQRMIDEARKIAAGSIEKWQCTKTPLGELSK